MDRRGSLTSILTIFVFLSISTTGISKADTADNVMRCQNSNVKLKCLNKSFILVITSVFYGRTQPGSIICPSPPGSHLSDEIVCNRQQNDVSDEVKQMCNEKNSCNFTVRKQTFGKDGCPFIFKYIIIEYKCVNSQKFKRHEAIKHPVIPTSSVVKTTSSVALSTPVMTSSSITPTVVIQPSSTSVLGVETINTVDQSDVPRSSSRSSTRLHISTSTNVQLILCFGFHLVYWLASL
ncbi:latrophilin-like protein 1 isoform X2 [Xenia sp. Carnegie-2017]|uniref:latrophilin-like protein 1 isoform X2 n=1 Tax=Xenia sp. Carnegie-2017 TaxID=2897299 RepID=UPI001F04C08A|nr:latrophilin-like protein 1 isoform X2 [Xenia sp. Carnegie-2017]